ILFDLHALSLNRIDRGRAFQEFDKRRRSSRSCHSGRYAQGDPGIVLQLIWERTDQFGTDLVDDLADLRHPQSPDTLGECNLGHIPAGTEFRLWLQLLGNAELLDHAGDVNASGTTARRGGIDDRLRGKQGAPELLGGSDRQLWGASWDDHTDADPCDRYASAGVDLAFLRQPFHGLSRSDDQVSSFASQHPVRNGTHGGVGHDQLDAGLVLELGANDFED